MSFISCQLGDLTQLITKGTTPTTIGGKFSESGVPFVRAQNITNGTISFENDALYIDASTHKLQKRSVIKAGDVLIAIAGTIGRVGVVPDHFPELNCNQAVAIIRVKNELNNRFLMHWLNSAEAITQIKSSTVVGVISNLSLSQISNLTINLPPLAEQQRIAEVLDKAAAIKAKREQAIAKLDELAQSTFVEMFGDVVANDKGWQSVTLGSVTSKLGSGATPSGGDASYKADGIPLIRSLNVHDGEFVYKNLAYIDDEQAEKLSNVVVQKNDVLLNITGASVARVCRVPDAIVPARVNQHVMIVRPTEKINPIFLERQLLTTPMKQKLLQVGGAGATREAITKAQAIELKVICPPIAAQIKFAGIADWIEKMKAQEIAGLATLQNLTSSLQHQAFTTGFNA